MSSGQVRLKGYAMVDYEQIKGWANEAVEMAMKTGLTLDYTRGSIGALERELDVLRLNERDDAATWDLACRFGAYLGEVMLRDFNEFGYGWDEDYDGEPILVSSYTVGNTSLGKILPITKCNKYLLSGPSESVAKLYAMCLSHLKGGDATDHLTSLGVDPSRVQGMEPAYVRGGRFDANAAAWLLYSDYVFFRPQEISWDGATHRMLGAQVNAAKINEIPTLVANTSLLNGLLDLMTQLEKDEGLRVPLFMVHPGVQDAIRNEDLTGITLFNLMAQAQALIVKEPEPNHYAVMCDSRLPMGIPAFYQLVARMIWDMRAYNERSGSFEVIFANARNLDADAVLGQVNEMVPGAFSSAIWKIDVMEKPQATLPSEEEARAFRPSEPDPEPFITISFSEDDESDEDLFEQGLETLAHMFPLVRDIEGTGYLDRIPRIEHVKVGDPLVLAADWENEWFDPACIEVFNAAGETLGNLRQLYSYPAGNRELACLLPYITATVETVTPKSKRRKNAKYALMDVRMELDPAVLGTDGSLRPEIIEEAKALLELPASERVVLSKGGVVASQLKGAIDASKARDVANPVGSTFQAQGSGVQRADSAVSACNEAQEPRPDATSLKQTLAETSVRDSVVVSAAEEVDPEESAKRKAVEEARRAEEEARQRAEEEERRRKEEAARFLSIASLSERMRSLAGDGYCTPSRIRTGFEDVVTVSQIEESLDRAWRWGNVRKVPAADGPLYAIGWSTDAWRKAREGENARLAAERDSGARESFDALYNELNEKIEDNEHFFNALRKYTWKFESQISGLKAQLAEARSKLNGIQDSKKQVDAEIEGLETELSKAGFFAFRRKGELREALRQNNEKKNALSKEEKSGEERITSLYEKLDALSRMTGPADKQIEETKSALSDQRRELEGMKLKLQNDVKESIRAMMSLYACPVGARWCVENVSGVNDESTARNALNKLVQTNDAIKLGTIDAYALTASGAHKRKPEEHGQDASSKAPARVASTVRKNNERIARELYRMLPYVPEGHTVRGIVGMGYPNASNSQKVAALLHVAVGMGLFQKIEDNTDGKKVVYYRRQARR